MEHKLLIVVSVIFALSLLGAFVLFKFLKSAAIIKRTGYQAGGALAGFLLIFGALYASYSQLEKSAVAREAQVELWTIVGEVSLEKDTKNSAEVEVSLLPPPPKTLSVPGGTFRFDGIGISKGEVPELQFETQGYLTESLLLNPDVADVDPSTKRITLKEPIRLRRGGRGAVLPPPSPAFGTLSGRVLKFVRSRSPLSGARVELRTPGTEKVEHKTHTDTDGRYSFPKVASGEYDLRVSLSRQDLDVIAPKSRRIKIRASDQRRLVITVTMQGRG